MNVKENKSVHLFYNTAKLFNTFRIISDPLKPFAPFGNSKYFWLSFTIITRGETKMDRKLHTRFEKRSERLEMHRDLSQKKKKVSLNKLKRTQRVLGEGLERVAYDPKSVKKFSGIKEHMNRRVYIQQETFTYAVNVF